MGLTWPLLHPYTQELSVSRRVTVPLDTEAPLIHPSAYTGLATWVTLLKIRKHVEILIHSFCYLHIRQYLLIYCHRAYFSFG